jgi:hypothetical protein
MPSSAREALSEVIRLFGDEGRLIVLKDGGEPFGTAANGADLHPYSDTDGPRSKLREKVAEVNARSRGEIL